MSRDPQGGPSREVFPEWAKMLRFKADEEREVMGEPTTAADLDMLAEFLASERLRRALDLEEAVRWIESNSVRMHRDEVLGWSAFVHRRDLPFYVEDHDTIIEAVAALRAKLAEKGEPHA